VPNMADSGTPRSRAAFMKNVMFSICLKGIWLVLTFLTDPGLMALTTLQSTWPFLSHSAKVWSPFFSPDTISIHSVTSFSRPTSYLAACFAFSSLSSPYSGVGVPSPPMTNRSGTI